ncbi:hypothetical protein GCM10009773_19810 [Williamsia serinedens]
MGEVNEYYLMMNGCAPDGCTCVLLREPTYDWGGGPSPAEWDQDPLCWVHPAEPGTWWDPIQSATPEWRAFVERTRRG